MIRFERKNFWQHMGLALLFSLVAGVALEMVLNYLHLSLLPLGTLAKHGVHLLLCFLVIGGGVLAYHLFPAVRNVWPALDYHLLNQETRHKAVDLVYAVLVGLMLLHHFYVLLYYPVLAAGAQKLTPIWLMFAACSIFLGKLWRRKEIWILSLFLVWMFERVYFVSPDLPDNTVIILSTAIYAFYICYGAFFVIRRSLWKTTLVVLCAVWTVATTVLSGIGLYHAWFGTAFRNLVGEAFGINDYGRLALFSNPNITGGFFAVGVFMALMGFTLSRRVWAKALYLVSVIPMTIATSLSGTRCASVAISVAVGLLLCLLLGNKLKGKKFRLPVLAVVFVVCFGILTIVQMKTSTVFSNVRDSTLTPPSPAEEEVVMEETTQEPVTEAPAPTVTEAPAETVTEAVAETAVSTALPEETTAPTAVPEETAAPTPVPEEEEATEEPEEETRNYYIQFRDGLDFSSVNGLLSGRLEIWQEGFRYAAAHPEVWLWGDSILNPNLKELNWNHYHNLYLQVLFESGIPGFLMFMGFIVIFLIYGIRLFVNGKQPLWVRFLPVPAAAILVMDLADCLTLFANGHVPLSMLYLFMGATVAMGASLRENAGEEFSATARDDSKTLPEKLPYNRKQLSAFFQKAVVVLLCFWIAVYACIFNRRQGYALIWGSALVFFVLPCWVGFRFLNGKRIFRNKAVLFGFLGIFALAYVLLGLNNSSVSIWSEALRGIISEPLWGHGRIIRGDEWAVWTPMLFSQASLGYPATNTAITASSVDPTLIAIGGLPAWSLAAVFKPFYWGFLLFGTTAGFSLMTLLRFGCLAFMSYRCALHYTKQNKPLSAAAAFLLSLAPYVQWWYSQSICEVLIFSQAMILCWTRILSAQKIVQRIGFGALSAWCLGCFLMVLYPAWLIPVGLLTVAVIAWLVVRDRKNVSAASLLQALAPIIVTFILVFFIVRNSWDTLMQVKNSVYPGQRLYTGGNRPLQLFTGLLNLLFPVVAPPVSNVTELSGFLSFAPAGVVLTGYQYWKTRKKDPLSVILLVLIGVFGLLALVPFPAWLTKYTLLSQCVRPGMVISLCDLLLLLRALGRAEFRPKRKASFGLALGGALLSVGLTWWMIRPAVYLVPVMLVVGFGVMWLLFSGQCKRLAALVLCLLAVVSGAFVNPVQQGFAIVEEQPEVQLVKGASLDADTVIAMEGEYPATNVLLFTGLRCFNSTQPYADPERWKAVDPEGKWVDVVNRLGHVSLEISEETSFETYNSDQIYAWLTLEDLRKLGVDVLMTRKKYPNLTVITENSDWTLYQL